MNRPFSRKCVAASSTASMVALLIGATACVSSEAPPRNVTLLVTNGTCVSAQCTPLHILAFPRNQPAGNTPGGPWKLSLGTSSAAQVCVSIPATASFEVIGGIGDTSKTVWSTDMPVTLGIFLDPADPLSAASTTPPFVPNRSAGWSVTLPGDSAPVPSAACTP